MIRLPTRPAVFGTAVVALAIGLQAVLAHDHHHHFTLPDPVAAMLEGTFKGANSGEGTVPLQDVTVQGHYLKGNIQLSTADGDLFPLSPLRGWAAETGHVWFHAHSDAGTRLYAQGTSADNVMSLAFVVENEDGTIVDAGLMSLTLTPTPKTEEPKE